MVFKKGLLLIVLLYTVLLRAQDKEEILLRIDDDKVYSSEFIRVFQKNKDIVVDYEKKNFDDYFNLFVDFKIKLKQAYELKLDTISSYQKELAKYREILVTPYLQDSSASEFLIKEAYDRTVTEVDASHILIRVAADAIPKDTLIAYNRIMEARDKILNGQSFEQVAKQYSEDPSVQNNGGNLGYFSAFSMVYPFENAAFNTKIGGVSKPFRTQFGFHIVKVNNRRTSLGEVQVAHIMVKKDPNDSTYAKTKIFDIYNKLEQGDDFAQIAKEHSDDTSSAIKGGVLPKFGAGRMMPPFDEIAFGLSNEGDFSEPFKTDYGWHILKLLKKIPVGSFEEQYSQLEDKIEKGSRSKYVKKALAEKLENNYEISENRNLLNSFYGPNVQEMKSEEVLLKVDNDAFSVNDFYKYSLNKRNQNIGEIYEEYKVEKIINYYKGNLEFTNKEFAEIYREYKDGLLLFELLQKYIWEKSEKDTLGLKEYYNNNKNNYVWKERAELTIASCTSLDKAELVKQYLENGESLEEIKGKVNEGATIHVLFSSGVLERESNKLPANYEMEVGVSEIYNEEKHQYTIIRLDKLIPPTNKELNETRGEVVNDYQNFLEKKWVQSLREKYKIKINKGAYNKLKVKYGEEE
jgi:peptidyl-prolyl cis-trans isomerase SurA